MGYSLALTVFRDNAQSTCAGPAPAQQPSASKFWCSCPPLPFKSRSGNCSHFLLALECYASVFSIRFFFSQLYQINAPSHSYWDSSVWYWRSRIHKKMELKRQTYVTCYSNIKYQYTELYYCIHYNYLRLKCHSFFSWCFILNILKKDLHNPPWEIYG